MNIEQIKQDRKNGVSVCNATWNKLIDAALLMQSQLTAIVNEADGGPAEAERLLNKIGKM